MSAPEGTLLADPMEWIEHGPGGEGWARRRREAYSELVDCLLRGIYRCPPGDPCHFNNWRSGLFAMHWLPVAPDAYITLHVGVHGDGLRLPVWWRSQPRGQVR